MPAFGGRGQSALLGLQQHSPAVEWGEGKIFCLP